MIESVSSLASTVRTPLSVSETKMNATSSVAQPFGTQQADFGDVLAKVTTDAMSTVRTGEAAAISGIQGKASVQQVVEAVMSAEQTLQTAMAVRDKVVAAYQEISRMAI
ncbi:flagellar hook-basal body complex protein FliE [Azorhizobium sp. AG788]|uniref:flagellar hook-basal body complex protein FliE n=1 Tax=Azorhizobium sp. AG788 TaxID=2183897 RepID=UPI0031389120